MKHYEYMERVHNNPYRAGNPTDLAYFLAKLAGLNDPDDDAQEQVRQDIEQELYRLEAWARNPYERDSMRTLYDTLVELADRYGRGELIIEE